MSKDTHGLQKVTNATFKYAVSGSKDSQPLTENNKLNVGTYTLYAYINGETNPVAETEFTVVQRAVTLRVVTPRTALHRIRSTRKTRISFLSRQTRKT